MGTQRPVVIGDLKEELGGPIAEHHGKKKEKKKKQAVKDKIKEEKYQKEAPKKEIAKESLKEESAQVKPEKVKKIGQAKIRSKKYQTAKGFIDEKLKYNFDQAIELVKKTTLTKFDGKVEVHFRILSKNNKPESVRGIIQYPHPTGKKVTVAILDEKTIEKIGKTKKANADIYLASPALMSKVAKLAKILGPKGKMPNPKAGTVTDDPEKTKKDLESGGQVEYKTDSTGNLHQVIGKVSAKPKVLAENFQALRAVLPIDKISSANICATMGPAIRVAIK